MQQTHNSLANQARQRQLERLSNSLKECQSIIIEMRDKYTALEKQHNVLSSKERELMKQLQQKNLIIEKLISQKQENMLHPIVCTGQALKAQLEEANKYCQMTQDNCKSIIEHYEDMIKKERKQFERLKELNRMVRVENQNLKDEVKRLGEIATQTRKIGTITKSQTKSLNNEENIFTITYNQSEYSVQKSPEILFTPNKLPQWKSTALPSTAPRNSTPNYSVQLPKNSLNKSRQTEMPEGLFQNQSIRSASKNNRPLSDESIQKSSLGIEVEGWFKRLGQLLADSDCETDE